GKTGCRTPPHVCYDQSVIPTTTGRGAADSIRPTHEGVAMRVRWLQAGGAVLGVLAAAGPALAQQPSFTPPPTYRGMPSPLKGSYRAGPNALLFQGPYGQPVPGWVDEVPQLP